MQSQLTPEDTRCKIYGCFLERVSSHKNNHRVRGYCNLHHRVLDKPNGNPDRQFNVVAPDRPPKWISVNTRHESKRFAEEHLCTWKKKHRSWGKEYDARMYTDRGLTIPPSDIDMSDDQLIESFDFDDSSPPSTHTTTSAETACQVLQAASVQPSIEQPLPAPPSILASPTIVAPLTIAPPQIQRSQGANGMLLLTQGESLPQTQQDLPDGTLGWEDKTPENHRSQVQLLIRTLLSEGSGGVV